MPTTHEDTLPAFIAKADARINARFGYQSDTLARWYELLCRQGEVEVGWRQCCGTRSVTAYAYQEWCKVIKQVERARGIKFAVERVKHKNAYASNKGGFWNSEIFRLPYENTKSTPRAT